ncbi:MAG: Nre family DNA repair protein [Candidatus Diapherotrites archaeon]|nr:Nre family DNA repair protein [Candidatus Micrarchaeota archaeon]MBU1939267.1 Nre family DNA repair protein [Candidatus Micrarchaeota archaeon]
MGLPISPRLCLRCKGRLLCGERTCRILESYDRKRQTTSKLSGTGFSGSSPPSVFVSWHSYPKITLAPLSPPELMESGRAAVLDNPEKWFGLPSDEIVSYREQLIRSSTPFYATDAANPTYKLAEMQELAMSAKPVDVEVELTKMPETKLSFSDSSPPMGPSAPLKTFSLSENPDVPTKVDYLVGDTDVKSTTAMLELYEHDLPVHYLYKILSAGLLGVKKNRKLVPTRWAITAADSNISNVLIDRIRSYPHICETRLFRSSYVDNHFYVLLVPGAWAFEQLEAWKPGSSWSQGAREIMVMADHEFYKGRTKYADNVTGAYYSARLAVAEYLQKKKRQAACIIFREIGGQYDIPLGVWVIRQTMRDAMSKKPLAFSDMNLALAFLKTKLSVPMEAYKRNSKILDDIKNQKRLSEWF